MYSVSNESLLSKANNMHCSVYVELDSFLYGRESFAFAMQRIVVCVVVISVLLQQSGRIFQYQCELFLELE